MPHVTAPAEWALLILAKTGKCLVHHSISALPPTVHLEKMSKTLLAILGLGRSSCEQAMVVELLGVSAILVDATKVVVMILGPSSPDHSAAKFKVLQVGSPPRPWSTKAHLVDQGTPAPWVRICAATAGCKVVPAVVRGAA